LYKTFVIAGNFDEIITRRTEIDKQFVMSESTNITKGNRESTIIHGVRRNFYGVGQCRHFVYHFQIADDQCSL